MAVRKELDIKVKEGRKPLNVRAEIYTSAQEVVNDCKMRSVKISEYSMAGRHYDKDWRGVNSYEEALQYLEDGYQPTVDDLRDQLKISAKGDGGRFSFVNNVQGFMPVVPLALMGVPNSMVNMTMKPIKTKVIDVYYDMTASCSIDSEQFIEAGKTILGAIIELEKQGYRFNLYAVQTYVGYDNTADMLCVKVKSSDRALDLKRISFPLTHPSFFRVIGFDWQGKSPIARDIGSGRGHALGYEYSRREHLDKIAKSMFGDNALYVSCAKIINDNCSLDEVKEVFTNDKTRKSK